MTRIALFIGLVVAVACASGPTSSAPVTKSEQVAAIELGFASGSFLAQVALPLQMRQESFAGFARGDADLLGFMTALAIPDADAAKVVAAMREGFADQNPLAGAPKILDAMNVVKDRLSAGAHPELMRVFRIGMVVAHMLETSVVITRGDPKPEHLQTFTALTGRYRAALPEDLAQAGLPADLTDAVRRTDVSVQSVEDLHAAIGACLAVQDLVGKMKAQ